MAVVPFDRSVLKVNQAILMGVIVVSYLIGLAYQPVAWVLPVLAVMMLVSAFLRRGSTHIGSWSCATALRFPK